MLVRAFRVTDRLGNAFLRISAWALVILLEQAASLKRGLFGILIGIWTVVFVGSVNTVRRTRQTAQQAVQLTHGAVEATASRRQQIMVQRAAEAELKPTIQKDPLLVQNRALSAFAVLLLLVLLVIVVLQTSNDDDEPGIPAGAAGQWPEARGTAPPTAIFPTAIPTATPIPDPLRVGGSLAYTMREHGQLDLWAIGVGESTPLRLTDHPADDRDPAWSPDGRRLAFASHRDGNWELYILDMASGAITRLTYTPGFEGAPTWSPDGAYIAFEGYTQQTQDLDIYVISSDPGRAASEGALRVTYAPGPDIEPAWSPQGRQIAYTAVRDGNQEIRVIDLNNPSEEVALNLTNSPNIDENHPAWNPDGTAIAYTSVVDGVEGVYIKSVEQPGTAPVLVGRGKMPTWAPNGSSLVYSHDTGQQTQLIAGTPGGFGAATDAISLPSRVTDPDWSQASLPRTLVESGGLPANPDLTGPLFVENERQKADGLYGMAPLNNVSASQAFLSDRVNDSFEAMRIRVLERAGYDFLGTLEDAFWRLDRPPDPGEPRENWHYAGRAIAIQRDLIYAGQPTPIEVVREDREVNTYWRVYVRVVAEAQNGSLGEPLRQIPWDLTARGSGDVEDYERGGRLKDSVPAGYYVDLTRIAEDFGWQRAPAQRTWQFNFGAIQFWELHNTGGKTWTDAMLELYTPGELDAFLSEATAVPPPPPLPTESPTPAVRRTATPIPPDLQ